MATLYSDIYEIFLRKITDFELANQLTQATPTAGENRMKGWLLSSIIKFPRCKTDLSDKDDTTATFNNTLSYYEKELLAKLMIGEWIEPQINHLLMVRQLLGDTDFKLTSQANHLMALLKLKDSVISDVDYWKVQYTYDTSDPTASYTDTLSDLG